MAATDITPEEQHWLLAETAAENGFTPAEGLVSDAQTAIKIAVAVWEAIYGKERIAAQAPYRAKSVDRVWLVAGALKDDQPGGVAYAVIDQMDGQLKLVRHSR